MKARTGSFYGVGVGPGDPELMTLKAVRVLEGARVIAAPSSTEEPGGPALLALDVVRRVLKDLRGKEVLRLHLPMTRDRELLLASREKAASIIAERLRTGMDVCFITLGDPMLYSTFGYLVPLVRGALPGVIVKAVPGVSSISAAASISCSPLAESDERVMIIPAAYDIPGVKRLLEDFDTVVLMKVNRKMDAVIELLEETGLADRAMFVSRAGLPEEEVVTDIKSLRGRKVDYFSMVIVRKGGRGENPTGENPAKGNGEKVRS